MTKKPTNTGDARTVKPGEQVTYHDTARNAHEIAKATAELTLGAGRRAIAVTSKSQAKRIAAQGGNVTLVSTQNTPRITVRNAGTFVRVVIPGYGRKPVALAHAIVAGFLSELDDGRFVTMRTPIGPGDHRHTCTTIDISHYLDSRSPTPKEWWPEYQKTVVAVVTRLVTPVGGDPAYDIVPLSEPEPGSP